MFNAEKNVDAITQWIKELVKASNTKGAVLGISGGKDSCLVAGLLCKALGKENVYGILMPNGVQADIEDSKKVCENLGIEYSIINIQDAYKGIVDSIGFLTNSESFVNINPRLRMTTLYAVAAEKNYLVAGTGNKSESYVGYFTKWGDGAHDFNPISDFTTDEVVAMGDFLGLPKEVMHKPPTDGISGLTDEEKLGFTYDDVNEYINNGSLENKEIEAAIIKKHNANTHKYQMPVKFKKL